MKPKKTINLKFINLFFLIIVLSLWSKIFAQQNTIDEIVAIINNEIILKSDIENELINAQNENYVSLKGDIKSELFENFLLNKLLFTQAKIDSIEVKETTVEQQLERRIAHLIKNFNSEEELEARLNKSIKQIKDELRDPMREQIYAQQMMAHITKDVLTTPSEIRHFSKTISTDSLPTIPTQLKVKQLVRYPKISVVERERIRKELRNIRERAQKGESFSKLAVLYSEDDGTANRGGELGYMSYSNLVPEFANVAFNLKENVISRIVETEYGFHIIKYVDRKRDKLNLRHILLKPKFKDHEIQTIINQLDTISDNIKSNNISFDEAVIRFSEDEKTRNNGGLLPNYITGGIYYKKSELPPPISQQIDNLDLLELSKPFYDNTFGKPAYKIIQIVEIIPEHKPNLENDWEIFENQLFEKKKRDILDKWINNKLAQTYVRIDKAYKDYKFRYGWIK